MNKLKKIALKIFSYGVSPVLMAGIELPGVPQTSPDTVNSIWVPMSNIDFPKIAAKIEDKKEKAVSREDWQKIGDQLTDLLEKGGGDEMCRLKLLINLACVCYTVKSIQWFEVCVEQSLELIEKCNIHDEVLTVSVKSLQNLPLQAKDLR